MLMNSKLQSLGSIINSCSSKRCSGNGGGNICINKVRNITNNISPTINLTIRNKITPIIQVNNNITVQNGREGGKDKF